MMIICKLDKRKELLLHVLSILTLMQLDFFLQVVFNRLGLGLGLGLGLELEAFDSVNSSSSSSSSSRTFGDVRLNFWWCQAEWVRRLYLDYSQ